MNGMSVTERPNTATGDSDLDLSTSWHRLHEKTCPRATPPRDAIDDAVRCYHDGCKHLFYEDTKSVLCPCCR